MARTKLQTPNFNLQKRADGYYDIRYTENGKTKNKSTGTKDPIEAEAARARFAAEYTKPKVGKRPTVTEICDGYVAARKDIIASPESLVYVFAPSKRHLGSLYADTLTQSTINKYIKTRKVEKVERVKGRWQDKPVSDATINKELRMLRAALNWAEAEHLIAKAPTYRIELTTGDVREDWITKEEANQLFDEASPHLALFLLISLSTAKRREAVLSLKWDKVVLHLPGHEALDFGDDVGNKRRGTTPIAGNTRLIEALKEAKAKAKTPYVIEYRGERVKDVKTALTATCKRAGVRHISAHTLKHSSITWMVQAGVAFERIAKFTNTSVQMIERVYGKHSPTFVAEAVGAVSF